MDFKPGDLVVIINIDVVFDGLAEVIQKHAFTPDAWVVQVLNGREFNGENIVVRGQHLALISTYSNV